jgi:hypothetical protein
MYGGSKHVSFFGHVPFLCFSSSKHNTFIVTNRSMHMHGKYNSRIRNTDPGSWKTVFDHDENYQVYVFSAPYIWVHPSMYLQITKYTSVPSIPKTKSLPGRNRSSQAKRE